MVGAGPSFEDNPDYPALRVVDFQVVGELANRYDIGYDTYLTVRPKTKRNEHIFVFVLVALVSVDDELVQNQNKSLVMTIL